MDYTFPVFTKFEHSSSSCLVCIPLGLGDEPDGVFYLEWYSNQYSLERIKTDQIAFWLEHSGTFPIYQNKDKTMKEFIDDKLKEGFSFYARMETELALPRLVEDTSLSTAEVIDFSMDNLVSNYSKRFTRMQFRTTPRIGKVFQSVDPDLKPLWQ